MTTTSRPIADRLADLINAGRRAEAVSALDEACGRDDPDALMIAGYWRLTGDILPRDLARSRSFFEGSAAAGRDDARRIVIGWLANGTGGRGDWPSAIRLLRERASNDHEAARQIALIEAMSLDERGDPTEAARSERICDSPAVSRLPGFFTDAECDYLIASSDPLMAPAVVVDPATGEQRRHPVRTSDGAAFPLLDENPAIHALNRRIAAASGLAVSHGEPLQVLRYGVGQEFRPHSDALPDADNQRALTMLVYLTDGYRGGETRFPAAGLSIRGRRGEGLLFSNVRADGQPDAQAIHAGTPILDGTKYVASRWIRSRPLDLGG